MFLQILGLALLGFKIWMLVDSIQRFGFEWSSINYWFFICWVPGGEWAYFFFVKIHDPEWSRHWKRLFQPRVSLEQLRYAAKNAPSVVNRLALAKGLYERDNYAEAKSIVDDILTSHGSDRDVLYTLAQCNFGLGNDTEGAQALEKIVATDFTWNNFAAAIQLATTYSKLGRRPEALELLRKVTKKSGQISHLYELGRLLAEMGNTGEAREVLERGLEDYRHSPRFIKRKGRISAKHAADLLASL